MKYVYECETSGGGFIARFQEESQAVKFAKKQNIKLFIKPVMVSVL